MIIPVGFAQVAVQFRYADGGRPQVITYGVELEGSDFGENRVQAIYDIWEDRYLPNITTNTRLEQVTLKYGPVSTGPSFVAIGTAVGASNEPIAPPNVTYLVKKVTNMGGRANRGRFFPPGVAEANVGNDGALSSGTVAALQPVFNNIRTDHAAADLPMVLLHSQSSDPTPITSLVLDPLAATQRRRLR
jgi:hypothetical protein